MKKLGEFNKMPTTISLERTYLCKHRGLRFTDSEVERGTGLGSKCYMGSQVGDICASHGKPCEVIQEYQLAHAPSPSSSRTEQDLKEIEREEAQEARL